MRTQIIEVGYLPFCYQFSFGRQRPVKNHLLFSVQHSGKIHIRLHPHFTQKIVDCCNCEAGDNLEILFIDIFQLIESRTHTQGVQDYILPGVFAGYGTDFLSRGIEVQGHGFLLQKF